MNKKAKIASVSALVLVSILVASIAVAGPGKGNFECNDGIDNDGDGLIDYPADPDCDSRKDTEAYNEPTITPPPASPYQ